MSKKNILVKNNLKELRVAKGLTQTQLADAVDLGLRFIQFLEKGEKNFTLKTLSKLADALDCKHSDIVPNLQPTTDPWAQEHLDALKGFDEAERKHYDDGMKFLFPDKFKRDD